MPGGGRNVINADIAAGLGGAIPRMPGGKANAHGGTIPGMPGIPGRGGAMLGLMRRGGPIGNGALGSFPDLKAAVV